MAAADVWTRRAQVVHQLASNSSSFFQGVGEDGKAMRVQFAAWKLAFL